MEPDTPGESAEVVQGNIDSAIIFFVVWALVQLVPFFFFFFFFDLT